jgi:hypothetical protein
MKHKVIVFWASSLGTMLGPGAWEYETKWRGRLRNLRKRCSSLKHHPDSANASRRTSGAHRVLRRLPLFPQRKTAGSDGRAVAR